MDKMIACCGLICTDCEAYVATQANDLVTLERLADRAREEFGLSNITTKETMCEGCRSNSERMCGYCAQCPVRACAVDRAMVNCAHCDDYGCQTLEDFFAMATEARATLDGIRAGLVA